MHPPLKKYSGSAHALISFWTQSGAEIPGDNYTTTGNYETAYK